MILLIARYFYQRNFVSGAKERDKENIEFVKKFYDINKLQKLCMLLFFVVPEMLLFLYILIDVKSSFGKDN